MRTSIALVTLSLSLPLVALADPGCGPLPVASEESAICIARQFVNSPAPAQWEVTFRAEEVQSQWKVSFSPTSSTVRGGSGELVVDKLSGKVTVVRLNR